MTLFACTGDSHLMLLLCRLNRASDRTSSFDSWKTGMQEIHTLKHAQPKETHRVENCVDGQGVYIALL